MANGECAVLNRPIAKFSRRRRLSNYTVANLRASICAAITTMRPPCKWPTERTIPICHAVRERPHWAVAAAEAGAWTGQSSPRRVLTGSRKGYRRVVYQLCCGCSALLPSANKRRYVARLLLQLVAFRRCSSVAGVGGDSVPFLSRSRPMSLCTVFRLPESNTFVLTVDWQQRSLRWRIAESELEACISALRWSTTEFQVSDASCSNIYQGGWDSNSRSEWLFWTIRRQTTCGQSAWGLVNSLSRWQQLVKNHGKN